MKSEQTQKAVIYCRVSGAKQVREGDGLASQATRCREYATFRGYDVINVFTDDVSGKSTSRVGMQSMLGYLHMNASKTDDIVVIIDDISRLARGLTAHLELRQLLAKAGGKLESPSIEFGEDSDSILVENLLASVAQHQREKNGEQTSNRMWGRMKNGYWVFKAPIGYKYKRCNGHGKMLVRDEPVASVIQEAMEGYASSRFESQVEIKRFLESQPAFPRPKGRSTITHQRVSDLLKRVIYTGHIEHAPWKLDRLKGHHEPIISLETYERIQARKAGRMLAPARVDIKEDFPLRGAVCCAECAHPLASCWSRSATGKRYPYFWCNAKSCSLFRKNIRAEKIGTAFEAVLQSLAPTKGMMEIVKSMLKKAWGQREAQAKAMKVEIRNEITQLDKQLDSLLDRIVETNNGTVIAAYEKKITKLENEKLIQLEKLDKKAKPKHTMEEIFELAMTFLSNPWNIWKNGELALRKTVLRLAFKEHLVYDRETGFRTPQVSVIFRFLDDLSLKNKMVRLANRPTSLKPSNRQLSGVRQGQVAR